MHFLWRKKKKELQNLWASVKQISAPKLWGTCGIFSWLFSHQACRLSSERKQFRQNSILHYYVKVSFEHAHQMKPLIGTNSLRETATMVAMPETTHCPKPAG